MAARPPSLDGSPPELAGGQPRANHRPEPIAASRAYGGVRFFHSVVCTGLMAYGEHWPELRRPGAGVDRQQNQTPRCRANQGSAQQSPSSSARHGPGGASFSRTSGALSEFVNLMGQLTTNRLWDTGEEVCPSQYTRMIPGTSAMQSPRPSTITSAPRDDE